MQSNILRDLINRIHVKTAVAFDLHFKFIRLWLTFSKTLKFKITMF